MATDPASVYLGLRARVSDLTPDALATALYGDRTLLKILGMRRTMFVTPVAGAYGSVGWITGFDDLASMAAANTKLTADAIP